MSHFLTFRKKEDKTYLLTCFAHLVQVNKYVFCGGFFYTVSAEGSPFFNVLSSQVLKCVNRNTYTEKLLHYRSMIYKELERNLSKTRVK